MISVCGDGNVLLAPEMKLAGDQRRLEEHEREDNRLELHAGVQVRHEAPNRALLPLLPERGFGHSQWYEISSFYIFYPEGRCGTGRRAARPRYPHHPCSTFPALVSPIGSAQTSPLLDNDVLALQTIARPRGRRPSSPWTIAPPAVSPSRLVASGCGRRQALQLTHSAEGSATILFAHTSRTAN